MEHSLVRERVREGEENKGEREKKTREAKEQTASVHSEVGKSDRCSFAPQDQHGMHLSVAFSTNSNSYHLK